MQKELNEMAAMQRRRLKKVVDPLKMMLGLSIVGFDE